MMLCNTNYVYFEELDQHLENLDLLQGDRKRHEIFFVSSDKLKIVAAMERGYCGIPVTKYVKFDELDYQLNILEYYLIKLQYNKDTLTKNINDFGIL